MSQFKKDYELGKLSEARSLPDLNEIFKTQLIHDPETFAHFDFYNDDIMVELKTRPSTEWTGEVMKHTTRTGREMNLDTLYFDSPKMAFAFQHNKHRRLRNEKEKRFYIVWKCSDQYFYWEMNWKGESGNREDFYIEDQNRDFGHGYKQDRAVVNVRLDKINHASLL